MNWSSIWVVLKSVVIPIIQFIMIMVQNYKEAQLKKAGAAEKEKEILENEKLVRNTLDSVDPDSLPDDEAFKPRQK